jgi:hypothetical protein
VFVDYQVVDNVLDNPYELIDFAKKAPYFQSFENSHKDGIVNTPGVFCIGIKDQISWIGYRTTYFNDLNRELFLKTFNNIFSKLLANFCCNQVLYQVESSFHIGTEAFVLTDNNSFHTDNAVCKFGRVFMAGVVYLSENPPDNSGTTILINNETIEIENVFNRAVFYNSRLMHKPTGYFGNTIDNSRLTLNFFIVDFSIKNSQDNPVLHQ